MAENFPLGQGHGKAGNYAGLELPFSDYQTSQVVILPIAFDQTTTYLHGTDNGPYALIEASRNMELYDIETDSEVYQKGICTLPILKPKDMVEMQRLTFQKVEELLKNSKFIVTIGGEHSITYPVIKAFTKFFSDFSVLQLDAHLDLQDNYEGNPFSHACVIKRVSELPNIASIVSCGIRSMSKEEMKNLSLVKAFYAHEMDVSNRWMEEAISLLKDQVYITFDCDVFDSSVMPSTGTPEPGGLFWQQATEFLKKVSKTKKIIGCDFVELCPNSSNLAPDYLTAKLVYKLLSYKFKYECS